MSNCTIPLEDALGVGLNGTLYVTEAGHSRVQVSDGTLRLTDYATPERRYSNAQVTDYSYAEFAFRWRPPLRMTVTAQASGPGDALRGTAGFGFWNHPFSPEARRLPRLPRALWFFFGSPPGDLALAHGQPGHGWSAMTIDTTRPRALALIPFALPAVLLMTSRPLYNRLWPRIQRTLRIARASLGGALLAERHTYVIEWHVTRVTFLIDGQVVLQAPFAPRGPMGFIAWIDNQYAVVTPRGRFGWGVLPLAEEQSLTLEQITIHAE